LIGIKNNILPKEQSPITMMNGKKLFESFSKITELTGFLGEVQQSNEEEAEFLKRLRRDGKELELKGDLILPVFRRDLKRNETL
jgi:hypothetical protein